MNSRQFLTSEVRFLSRDSMWYLWWTQWGWDKLRHYLSTSTPHLSYCKCYSYRTESKSGNVKKKQFSLRNQESFGL